MRARRTQWRWATSSQRVCTCLAQTSSEVSQHFQDEKAYGGVRSAGRTLRVFSNNRTQHSRLITTEVTDAPRCAQNKEGQHVGASPFSPRRCYFIAVVSRYLSEECLISCPLSADVAARGGFHTLALWWTTRPAALGLAKRKVTRPDAGSAFLRGAFLACASFIGPICDCH